MSDKQLQKNKNRKSARDFPGLWSAENAALIEKAIEEGCGQIELDPFYLDKEEPNKSCLLALRSIILEQDDQITERWKYGMPCFCYKKKMFCYLWVDKKTNHPYILMVEGKYLTHPQLEEGGRSRMKIFRVDPNKDLPIRIIKAILKKALDLYRKGLIKLKN